MKRQRGFTYVGVIVLVAIIGLVGAATLRVGTLMQRAAAEEELLEIGAAFSEALRSYAAATPKGQPPHPQNLGDLLKDPRFPGVKRHLRKLFVDPITGSAEWGLVTAGDGKGGILGFYSLSESAPLKVANFDARFSGFEHRNRISDWKFTAGGQGVVVSGSAPSAPPGTNPVPISEPPLRQPQAPVEPPQQPEPAQQPAENPAPAVDPPEPVEPPSNENGKEEDDKKDEQDKAPGQPVPKPPQPPASPVKQNGMQ